MIKNVGSTDKKIRILAGVALIAAPFVSNLALFDNDAVTYGATAVGLVLIATGVINFCPLYRIFGIRTCKL